MQVVYMKYKRRLILLLSILVSMLLTSWYYLNSTKFNHFAEVDKCLPDELVSKIEGLYSGSIDVDKKQIFLEISNAKKIDSCNISFLYLLKVNYLPIVENKQGRAQIKDQKLIFNNNNLFNTAIFSVSSLGKIIITNEQNKIELIQL